MRVVATLLLLCAFACSAHAQIPIKIYTPDFVFEIQHDPNSISTYSCQDPAVLSTVLQTGDTDIVWDFTKAKYTMDPNRPEVDSFMLPTGLPLANDSDFANADEVILSTISPTLKRYQYFNIRQEGAYKLGVVEVTNGVAQKLAGWNPPYEDAGYPLLYQASWQSTSEIHADTLRKGARHTIASTSTVTGWGTLKLPYPYAYANGSLRVKEQTIETWFQNGEVIKLDTVVRYHFYTPMLFSATIATDPRGVILGAYYTVNFAKQSSVAMEATGDALGLTISENPASNTITRLRYSLHEEARVRVELMDMLGRSVKLLESGRMAKGQHDLEIDPTKLANGTYFVRVEAAGKSAMQKLIVAR